MLVGAIVALILGGAGTLVFGLGHHDSGAGPVATPAPHHGYSQPGSAPTTDRAGKSPRAGAGPSGPGAGRAGTSGSPSSDGAGSTSVTGTGGPSVGDGSSSASGSTAAIGSSSGGSSSYPSGASGAEPTWCSQITSLESALTSLAGGDLDLDLSSDRTALQQLATTVPSVLRADVEALLGFAEDPDAGDGEVPAAAQALRSGASSCASGS